MSHGHGLTAAAGLRNMIRWRAGEPSGAGKSANGPIPRPQRSVTGPRSGALSSHPVRVVSFMAESLTSTRSRRVPYASAHAIIYEPGHLDSRQPILPMPGTDSRVNCRCSCAGRHVRVSRTGHRLHKRDVVAGQNVSRCPRPAGRRVPPGRCRFRPSRARDRPQDRGPAPRVA